MEDINMGYQMLISTGGIEFPFEVLKEYDKELCMKVEDEKIIEETYELKEAHIDIKFKKSKIEYSIFRGGAQIIMFPELYRYSTEKKCFYKEQIDDFIKRDGLIIYHDLLISIEKNGERVCRVNKHKY